MNRFATISLSALLVAATLFAAEARSADLEFGGAGWLQYGMIGHSSDTAGGIDLNRRGIISSGAQIALRSQVTPRLKLAAGIGAASGHNVAGSLASNGGYAPMSVNPYIAEANFTFYPWNEENSGFFLRGGLFPYDYLPEAQNLGLYLLRGPVYPGLLLSGYETKYVLPIANMLGLQAHQQVGSFEHDLLVNLETEFYPYYDLSPAYIAGFRFGNLLRIGAGVNFYHLISIDKSLTSDSNQVYIDTIADDTTAISFRGTKVMANATLDIKAFFGSDGRGALGPEDLKVYGEIALIGLDNGKAYKAIYGDMKHRMPMMLGFNLPAFKVLDRLGIEVEWYGAPFADDLARYEHVNKPDRPSPFPIGSADRNIREDNFKWSIYGSRVLENHVKLSFQVANDHFRPGIFSGYGDNSPARSDAVMSSPKDWYWMSKVAFFF
jgi:hypothetical protein